MESVDGYELDELTHLVSAVSDVPCHLDRHVIDLALPDVVVDDLEQFHRFTDLLTELLVIVGVGECAHHSSCFEDLTDFSEAVHDLTDRKTRSRAATIEELRELLDGFFTLVLNRLDEAAAILETLAEILDADHRPKEGDVISHGLGSAVDHIVADVGQELEVVDQIAVETFRDLHQH